jgi:biopolymer transport protein ExbB/TolQ
MGVQTQQLNWFQQGGVAMYILTAFSIILVAITVEKLIKLARLKCRFEPAEEKVLQLVRDGDQAEMAKLKDAKLPDLSQRPIYLIGYAVGLKYSYEGIARALEREIQRLEEETLKGIAWVASIGNVAPFVGLFGTVLGIIRAFRGIGGEMEKGSLQAVSRGISEALVATAAGLAVAIPAVILYNLIARAIRARLVKVENEAREFLDRMKEGGMLDA